MTTRRRAIAATHIAVGLTGLILVLLALRMDASWASRHFLPAWSFGWDAQLRILLGCRLAVAAAGLAILWWVRRWAAARVGAGLGRETLAAAFFCALAVAAGFGATELILRTSVWHNVQDGPRRREPARIADAELGWATAPNRATAAEVNGREIHYATGPTGYRVASVGERTDFRRPTIVLAGESIMLGYGLEWPETIGARLQARTGIATATIAICAQSTDQVLIRLQRELPRFAQPVAVVIPFMPRLLDRNLDRDRPHLDSGLHWHKGEGPSLRIVELGRRIARYRSSAAIEDGIKMTRAALRRAIELASRRGAAAIILVPQFLPESEAERRIRRELLDAAGIPYLLVPIPPEWRNREDGHPDPRGAAAIANALADRLRPTETARP